MKVLFISHEASQTGAPFALLQELKYLRENHKDIECEVLMLWRGDLFDEFKKLFPTFKGWFDPTIFNRILGKLKFKRAIKPYLYACKYSNFDAIYANSVASFHAAVEIKRKYNIPLIGHVHEAENLLIEFKMSKDLLLEFDKLIAVSGLTARNLKEIYDVPSEKIVIQRPVSYFVDKAIKEKTIIKSANIPTKKVVIGIVCKGNWWKGIELIPVAIKNFFNHYPDANCIFAIHGGIDDSALTHLKYDLRESGMIDRVMLGGVMKNPVEYYARYDIFLLLSREESFSLVAQEAAFVGTPIVGFERVTGAAEWLADGAGLLVPYMDFDKLSESIYTLYEDNNLRNKIAIKAKEKIMKMYYEDLPMTNIMKAIYSATRGGKTP